MILTSKIHIDFKKQEDFLNDIISNFDTNGENYGNQDRNSLKLFKLDDKTVNVKSFKTPNFINQFVYRFFRKSKAQRSFEYANKLIEFGIGTPQPIAYYEFKTLLLFKKSFYISVHLDYDLTFRELTTDLNYPDHDAILRAFTRFTYKLHQKGVNFLDHSPGNTLIKKVGNGYQFYLVDLNRMQFKPMNLEDRAKNFSRLSKQGPIISVMANEYAKCIGKEESLVLDKMWYYVNAFQYTYTRRAKLKKIIKFWKR